MSEDGFLEHTRVAIAGLGLMGGSLAMALRGRCAALLGFDPNPDVVKMALDTGIVDVASCEPENVFPSSGLVVLAAPVFGILSLIQALPRYHPEGAVVMDLGSTKRMVVEAMDGLPSQFDPLGGHPMCGKEKTGLENAHPGLYGGATFALCALSRTSFRARRLAEELAGTVGARPAWIAPEVHDAWAGATSHLPYLAACALALATPEEASALVGPGFLSTTRVASTSSQVMEDILRSNADTVLASLAMFRSRLDDLEEAMREERWIELAGLLDQAAEQRKALIGSKA